MTADEREALRLAIDARRRELESEQRYSAVKNKHVAVERKPRVVLTHSRAGYCNGCRCDICCEGQRVYNAKRRARRAVPA